MDLTNKQYYNIKGIGIALIMIHNFVDHLLKVQCNEMSYSQSNTDEFIFNLHSAGFTNFIGHIFAFVGWIGVPLFFFLSGYGLSKKYGIRHIKIKPYVVNHALKLWKLLVPIYLIYIVISHFLFGQTYQIKGIFTILTFTANFFADTFFEPGVYWFFGAIFQFYILFMIIRKFSNRLLFGILIIALLSHYYILFFCSVKAMLHFRYNFCGWLAPFVIGIIYDRCSFSIHKVYVIIICISSLIALCFCFTNKLLVPLAEIFMICFTICLVSLFSLKSIYFLGVISSSIFVIHPLIRMIFKHTLFGDFSTYPLLLTLIYVIITIVLSWYHHRLLSRK